MEQLQETLGLAGANAARWPATSRARLAAFVESDAEAGSLFAEAKALDKILSHAPGGSPSPAAEARILAAAAALPQNAFAPVEGGSFVGGGRNGTLARAYRMVPRPSLWGGAALMAASLVLGIYIGATGEAMPALRGMAFLASSDEDAGIAFSGSLFEPSGLQGQGAL
jgi:hypothetical protein